jgi:hypothetical protein
VFVQICGYPEPFDFAVERRDFYAQQFCRASLIPARTLECVANEFALVSLHLFL